MKPVLATIILMMFFTVSTLSLGGARRVSLYKQTYKNALDAATDAATKATAYSDEEHLIELSYGFGNGYENGNNIPLDKNQVLKWFYDIFYRNLNIQNDVAAQNRIKKYIPLKCVISFSNLSIADVNDSWVFDKSYIIPYGGKNYLFTLSDEIRDLTTYKWLKASDIGLSEIERQTLVSTFIEDTLEYYLNTRSSKVENGYYTISLGVNDLDTTRKKVGGSNVIVLAEGLPIPSLNWFNPTEKFYAFSIGGTEITRKS